MWGKGVYSPKTWTNVNEIASKQLRNTQKVYTKSLIYGRIESSMDFNGKECPESDLEMKNNKNNINPEGRK